MTTRRIEFHRVVRFLVVGGGAALLYFMLCFALQTAFGYPPFIASLAAYAIAFGFAYWLQHTWTFRSTQRRSRTLVRYALLQFLCAVLAASTLQLSMEHGIEPLYASAIATVMTAVTGFVLSAYWAFAGARR